jgi:hypothetical protein
MAEPALNERQRHVRPKGIHAEAMAQPLRHDGRTYDSPAAAMGLVARSAAMQVVPIIVPNGACRTQSAQIDEVTKARRLSELTGAEIVALANNGIPLSAVSD